ncbi:LacI family DNA-binding transcriptional regulator [Devosia sp.]|uniref:LacI family DNA-binding transcriptional regulator n=1 Tax=Devosia sp. TaxID=1871048 RepID=UPI003262F344
MVTIKEIAKAVGVSSATVSRVLNFDATLSVTEQKRQAIIETAEAMNYATPRNRARAAQQSAVANKIALVHFLRPHQELVDPYYVGLRLGIESRCHALQMEAVKVYHTDSMPEASLLQSASGVIAIGSHSAAEYGWLKRHSKHLVFADYIPPDDEFDSVESDLPLAMRKLLGALTEIGYRRIGFIGWIEGSTYGEKRCRSYIEWMNQHSQFDPHLCITGQVSDDNGDRKMEQAGHRLAKTLMSQSNPPEAFITCNDNMAVGAYRAMAELGLRIPEDVAIASFNDISVAQFLNPPLSTTRLPSEEIGEAAVDLLVERIAGRELAKRITLATEIKWRSSTRRPQAAQKA